MQPLLIYFGVFLFVVVHFRLKLIPIFSSSCFSHAKQETEEVVQLQEGEELHMKRLICCFSL